MTNTLHRYGDRASFRDDYIVFAMCSRGKNDENAVSRLRQFLEMALQFNPVNLGDARHGGALRPSRSMAIPLDEPAIALEAQHNAGFPRGHRWLGYAYYGGRGI
jgi:hypothetical protein